MATSDDATPGTDVPGKHRGSRDLRQRFSDGRMAFRSWRRSRPFWGGLLLIIAGLELFALPLSGVLIHGALKLVIYIGIGGVFGVLIGVLLVAAGIMCWLTPVHRIFYGIAGIVLGVLSFPTSNLGGFFLGMLLAIVGGSMAFAWTHMEPRPVKDEPAPAVEPSAGLDLLPGSADETPDDETPDDGEPEEPQDGEQRQRGTVGYRALAVATMPALLVAGVLSAPAARTAPQQLCILGICIGSSPSPSPSPTPSAGSPSASASASANPQPGSGASPGASASAGASAPGTGGKTSASPSPTSTKVKHASSDGLVVSSSTSVLTAGSATLDDFTFEGIVNMPLASGGTEKMLKFSASSADLTDGVTVSITESGQTLTTSNSALTTTGGLTLYATSLTGTIEGVVGPVTFTPTTIDALLLKLANVLTGLIPLTMTNVTTDQFLMTGGTQQWFNTSQGF